MVAVLKKVTLDTGWRAFKNRQRSSGSERNQRVFSYRAGTAPLTRLVPAYERAINSACLNLLPVPVREGFQREKFR